MTATGVGGVTITAQGSGYTGVPTVTFAGGAGAGAAGTAVVTLATTDLSITVVPAAVPQPYESVEVWATPAFPPGRTFVTNLYRYIASYTQPVTSPLDISVPWVNVFGSLPTTKPYKIGVRARIINSQNGARSEFVTGFLLQT
jgi:hypothetical protein